MPLRTFAGPLVFAGALVVSLPACHHHGSAAADAGSKDASVLDQGAPSPDLTTLVFSDFPSTPQSDPGLPADVATQLGASNDAGGTAPCVSEPAMGALIPDNWTPLYFEWSSAGNLYELRLHVANQQNDLVVYTAAATYTMPSAMWTALSSHSRDLDITVSVRSATLVSNAVTATSMAAIGTIRIAPVAAQGNIVYWTTTNGSALKGYGIGSSTVSTLVSPAQLGDGTTCVGCHASSPDGKYTFFSRQTTSAYSLDARTVDGKATKAAAGDVSVNAFARFMRTNQTLPVLSGAHYSAVDAVAVSVLSGDDTSNKSELVWTDLHATSGGTGIIARMGDVRQAAEPSWSHDGATIAYASSADVYDGRTSSTDSDLYTVPYNDHKGGVAKAVPGASEPGTHEYYPVFSPDDALLAYNQSPPGADTYNEPTAEVRVIAAAGGTAQRLSANDPPACTGLVSPGQTNSWPRWSPEVTQLGGKSYYWIVFSSRRHPGGHPQLYVAGIVKEGTTVTDFPAVYVSAQPAGESNHTPAWDVFQIPVQ